MNIDKSRVPKGKDKRVKITDDMKEQIHARHEGGESIHSISREMEISRRSIGFILYPERLKENLKRRDERGGWQQYYDKDKHREATARHRAYKKGLNDE